MTQEEQLKSLQEQVILLSNVVKTMKTMLSDHYFSGDYRFEYMNRCFVYIDEKINAIKKETASIN